MRKKSFKALAIIVISFFIVSFAGMACSGNIEVIDRGYSWCNHIKTFFHHFYYSLCGKEDSRADYPLIIQKLAEKLELDPEKVMEAFEDLNRERKKGLEGNFGERLDQAVKEGIITGKQKEAITAKREELEVKVQEIKGLAAAERSGAIEDMIGSLKNWAEENNIDIRMLFPLMHHGATKADRFIRRHNFKSFK